MIQIFYNLFLWLINFVIISISSRYYHISIIIFVFVLIITIKEIFWKCNEIYIKVYQKKNNYFMILRVHIHNVNLSVKLWQKLHRYYGYCNSKTNARNFLKYHTYTHIKKIIANLKLVYSAGHVILLCRIFHDLCDNCMAELLNPLVKNVTVRAKLTITMIFL